MRSGNNELGRSLRPRSENRLRPVAETFSGAGLPEEQAGPRRTKTSLTLDIEVYRRAKIAAIEQGVTVSEFVEQAMTAALDK